MNDYTVQNYIVSKWHGWNCMMMDSVCYLGKQCGDMFLWISEVDFMQKERFWKNGFWEWK